MKGREERLRIGQRRIGRRMKEDVSMVRVKRERRKYIRCGKAIEERIRKAGKR